MPEVYETLRAVQARLQAIQKQAADLPASPERTVLVEALDTFTIIVREYTTIAHLVNQVEGRQADLSTALEAIVERVFGKGGSA